MAFFLGLLQFLRAIAECFACLSHGLGVRPFVCPSVTLVSRIKTMQARITKSSLWASPRTSFSWQNLVPLGAGVPLERGVKEEYLLWKDVIFSLLAHLVWKQLQVCTDIQALMTGFLDLLTSMTFNDLEPPKEGFLCIFHNFWLQCTFQKWISTKCLKIDQDYLHVKISALNADFSSPSVELLGSKRPAHESVKEGYFSKKWLFYWYWLF